MIDSLNSPIEPAMMPALAFIISIVSLVASAFLYAWFLDYREENNTKMDRVERKIKHLYEELAEFEVDLKLMDAKEKEERQNE
jgi:hypothetical protein